MKARPGEDLIQALETLRVRLNQSGIERTEGLRQAMTEDCSYYRKSLHLFLDRDCEEIELLMRDALAEYRKAYVSSLPKDENE